MSSPTDPASVDRPTALKNYRPARSEFRSRNHDSVHSGETPPSPPMELPQNALIPRGNAELITSQSGLDELLAHVRAMGSFAYDSEFIGELTYIPKLCLIQIATRERVVLVDPLAPIDLRGFWDLICDASVEKVVHAGAQDLEPAVRATGRLPANVFDTQIASGFLGMTYPVALSKLVKELTGVALGKGPTFTHWDQRPLSTMQTRYAADDVRFLPALREEIGNRLARLGHASWAVEECNTLCDASMYRFDPAAQFRRVRGAINLNGGGLAILRELVVWRDTAARAHDVPPRSFLKDEILVDLARNPVKSVERLNRVKGLPRPVELAHGKDIVDATTRGLVTPMAEHPAMRGREETPIEKFQADGLWAAVQSIALGRSIDPNLICSRAQLGQLYHHLIGGDAIEDIPLMCGWRYEAVGRLLVDMVKSGAKMEMAWVGSALVAKRV